MLQQSIVNNFKFEAQIKSSSIKVVNKRKDKENHNNDGAAVLPPLNDPK
jgi:hypothetical protein